MLRKRKINGITYYLMGVEMTRENAKFLAQTFRKNSESVRVIPCSVGYNVWAI